MASTTHLAADLSKFLEMNGKDQGIINIHFRFDANRSSDALIRAGREVPELGHSLLSSLETKLLSSLRVGPDLGFVQAIKPSLSP